MMQEANVVCLLCDDISEDENGKICLKGIWESRTGSTGGQKIPTAVVVYVDTPKSKKVSSLTIDLKKSWQDEIALSYTFDKDKIKAAEKSSKINRIRYFFAIRTKLALENPGQLTASILLNKKPAATIATEITSEIRA